jgi:hypothetical protein
VPPHSAAAHKLCSRPVHGGGGAPPPPPRAGVNHAVRLLGVEMVCTSGFLQCPRLLGTLLFTQTLLRRS